MRLWRDWPLATKLAILLVALVVIPLGATAVYTFVATRSEQVSAIRAQSLQRARATAQVLDSYLSNRLAAASLLAQAPQTVALCLNPGKGEAAEHVAAMLHQAAETLSLELTMLANPRGEVVSASDPLFIGNSQLTAQWFQMAMAGQSAIGDPRMESHDAHPILHVSVPVRNVEGAIVGAVGVRFLMTHIDQLLAADTNFSGRDESGAIWDEFGLVLSSPRFPEARFRPLAPLRADILGEWMVEQRFGKLTQNLRDTLPGYQPLVDHSRRLFLEPETGVAVQLLSAEHETLHVTIVPLAQKRWLYGIFTSEAAIDRSVWAITKRELLAAGAAALLAVAVALHAARVISRPVRAVAETATALAAGEMSRRVGFKGNDEVGKLSQAFDAMADILAVKEARLADYAHELEKQVAQRTVALQFSEEKFRQAQKMDAVGRVAGGIAHDFNNLLTAILGYNELLLDQLAQTDPRRSWALEVRRAVESASEMTKQLLAFSRKQVLQLSHLDLNEVVSNMRNMLSRVIGEHMQLMTDLNPEIGQIKADSTQLQQVLLNLSVNARDAMPNGGVLTIGTGEVAGAEVSAGEDGPQPEAWVVLSVADTGMGMDPRIREHLFEPFFTTKDRGRGTGLGLSTVYGIVKQSGGEIRVWSEPGEGTTFRIYLPRVTGAVSQSSTLSAENELPKGHETILLVEDDEQVRSLAASVLTRQGYQVLTASNGGEALERSRSFLYAIDLLLTDIVMPGMSGFELARRLRELRQFKVIFMSGYSDVPASLATDAAGRKIIRKPFSPLILANACRDVLDGNSV